MVRPSPQRPTTDGRVGNHRNRFDGGSPPDYFFNLDCDKPIHFHGQSRQLSDLTSGLDRAREQLGFRYRAEQFRRLDVLADTLDQPDEPNVNCPISRFKREPKKR